MNKLKNPIQVAALTLRFYQSDGWTLGKVRELLVNPNFKIELRPGNKPLGISGYYACYERSGFEIFKKSKVLQHQIINNRFQLDINWFLDKYE